jgi:anti-anti-sigma factor
MFAAPGNKTFLAEGNGLERRDVFSVRVDRLAEDLVVMVVVGEIDSVTAPKLSASLHRELERQPAVLVLDLTGVSFLGVAGLPVLDCALDRAETLSVTLKLLHHDQSAVQAALRAAATTGLFPTLRTVAQACTPSTPVTRALR